ncbi:MAG: hypothetical protein JRE57_05805 [Deltaproteobacteria bacterium]|nr:hypothetical protein [Deltaproteobacteria bacterium]
MSRAGLMTWVSTLLMVAAGGCIGEQFPTQLIGTWVATSPSHQGRFIEISEEHVIFSSDESHSIFYTIHGIESIEREEGLEYTIEYRGVGNDSRRITLRLSDRDPVAIELANQDGTWVRKGQITPKRKDVI